MDKLPAIEGTGAGFSSTLTEVLPWQPLASVTVTEILPGVPTAFVCAVEESLHK